MFVGVFFCLSLWLCAMSLSLPLSVSSRRNRLFLCRTSRTLFVFCLFQTNFSLKTMWKSQAMCHRNMIVCAISVIFKNFINSITTRCQPVTKYLWWYFSAIILQKYCIFRYKFLTVITMWVSLIFHIGTWLHYHFLPLLNKWCQLHLHTVWIRYQVPLIIVSANDIKFPWYLASNSTKLRRKYCHKLCAVEAGLCLYFLSTFVYSITTYCQPVTITHIIRH